MNLDALATVWSPRLLSIMRIMAGRLFLQHGTAKLELMTLPGIAAAGPGPWSYDAMRKK